MEQIQDVELLEGKALQVKRQVHDEEVAIGLSVPFTLEELEYESALHNDMADEE